MAAFKTVGDFIFLRGVRIPYFGDSGMLGFRYWITSYEESRS